MKHRSSFQAAAVSAATVIGKSASTSSLPMNASRERWKPIEIDLADPKALRHWTDGAVELFAQLEELYPDDPGQKSGGSLRIAESGEYGILNAQIGDQVRTTHCVGYLFPKEVAHLAERACRGENCTVPLHEMCSAEPYPCKRTDLFSGATLAFFGGEDAALRLCFGDHCLGILTGCLLTAFLACMRIRFAGMEIKCR
jgi:hypothetical protein